jgi:UDP-2,3-diacylglucosamine pyrophosphatase LpxH
MLVIISDLHLNDGTAGGVLNAGAVDMFAERLCDLAARASWRTDGRYRPVDRIDLLLLGDVLDLLQSRRWLDSGTRPWEDPQSPKVAETVTAIVDGILQQNRNAISVLRSLYGEGAIHIPAANQAGEPVYGGEGHSVAVRTFYMVGNRDWLLHLSGTRYDLVRQKVANQMGLANAVSAPFPHDPLESEELLQVLRRHRVIARHGDIYDPLSYCEDRDASALGDALVIELVGRFLCELQRGLAEGLPAAALDGLREIDRIRPLLAIPAWIDGLLQRTGVDPATRKHLKRTWDQLADEFLQLPVVRAQDAWSPFELVDGLERALKFSKRLSRGWMGDVTRWLQRLRGVETDSYAPQAATEEDFRNRRARHIVYGHTHQFETVPLDASYADGYVLNQVYFNAGTWRRVYHLTQGMPASREFVPVDCLSYLAFFAGDERGGRAFETWSGSLATDVAESTVHRVDTARTLPEPPPAPAAAHLPLRSPHFQRPTTSARHVPGQSS